MVEENFRLTVFRAVAKHSSFNRAAQELLLPQAAVTQQIKALEEQFGRPLFDRGGGRVSLTPGGTALLPFAEQIKALSEDAFAAVAKAYGQKAGELVLGVADDRTVSAPFHCNVSADTSAGSHHSTKRQHRSDAGRAARWPYQPCVAGTSGATHGRAHRAVHQRPHGPRCSFKPQVNRSQDHACPTANPASADL